MILHFVQLVTTCAINFFLNILFYLQGASQHRRPDGHSEHHSKGQATSRQRPEPQPSTLLRTLQEDDRGRRSSRGHHGGKS